jgi:RNA polymerase sigma-70 factor (ECF subfamily)
MSRCDTFGRLSRYWQTFRSASDKPKREDEAGVTSVTDEELIMRVIHGDAIAFETLVNRHLKSALRLARRFTVRGAEDEDMVQEAFLQVHRHINQYDPGAAPFKTWFFAILSNLCRNAARRDKSLSFIEVPENASAIDDPEGDLANEEQRAALAAAVVKLPPNQRLALILRYEECFSYAEIATALGISISAVRSLLVRAKRTLRRELAEFEKKPPD